MLDLCAFIFPPHCIFISLVKSKLTLSTFLLNQRIPVWWRWYYWANPIAWSLYGLLTSQYGTIDDPVKLSDGVRSVPLRQLLKDQFGYRHDFLVIAAIAVPSFSVIFALTFGFAIKSFNFQRR